MKINQEGLRLIMKWEGFRSHAYRDIVGVWTIGFGHTSMAGPPEVKRGMSITYKEGEALLWRDLGKYEKAVLSCLKHTPTENQFAAMVSLCYNIGPTSFQRSSVVRFFNMRDYKQAALSFMLWNKAKDKKGKLIPVKGLTNRRFEEAQLFSKA